MEIALLVARLLLAAVFAVAGLAKLADRNGSQRAIGGFGVPAMLATPLGVLLPLAELAVALAMIPTRTAWWGAAGARAPGAVHRRHRQPGPRAATRLSLLWADSLCYREYCCA